MSTFFHFSYHVSGLLHVVVCVLKCCKEHPLFLVLFCSWLSIHLRAFTSGKHVHICITLSVCLSPYNKLRTARWIFWEFYNRKLYWKLSIFSSFGKKKKKKSTLVWYTYISACILNVKPEYLLELKYLERKL
jgi:hypothetical protein